MPEKANPKPSRASGSARREGIRRTIGRERRGWREALRRPLVGWALLILLGYGVGAGALAAWSAEQPRPQVGRVMDDSRVARVDFQIEDLLATEAEREFMRRTTPRYYVANRTVFETIQQSLESLPTSLADAESVDEVAEEIRREFQLDEQRLAAIRSEAEGGEAGPRWREKVRDLVAELRRTPVLDRDAFQLEQQEANSQLELEFWDREQTIFLDKAQAVNIAGGQLRSTLERLVRRAGFRGPERELIIDWLERSAQPTFSFSETMTQERKDLRAENVDVLTSRRSAGDILYRRGDVLSSEQREARLVERSAFYRAEGDRLWWRRGALVGAALLITGAAAVYIAAYCRRLSRNTTRMVILSALSLILLTIAAVGSANAPGLAKLWVAAPTAFLAMILVVAYDQRVALALTVLHALLVAFALDLSLGGLALQAAGAGVAVWQLREIRHRNAVVRAGLATALALALASAVTDVLRLPLTPMALVQIGTDALLAALGGVGVAILLMALLPTIERVFGITTGMTLIELRDPKHPLLRELQQRAPGTYSHSMTVATLAETAADAVGADGLELYVGALYHDVGKMNKPDYFVENQPPGFNRHEKLNPRMSLLIILGHVKDGVELAREYNLPKKLHHYIESHHGTTLVEYFYRQAQHLADLQEQDRPPETEYRYPGPKPRTKEAAILMLCDGVESATRAMTDPTPSRIESLVHEMAMKRLTDGQFDESGLTFKELNRIEKAIAKTLSSIYHGRIAYPAAPQGKGEKQESAAREPAAHPAPGSG